MVGKRVLGILGVLSSIAGIGLASGAISPAMAQTSQVPIVGIPHDWQMNFPASYTPLMEKVASSIFSTPYWSSSLS